MISDPVFLTNPAEETSLIRGKEGRGGSPEVTEEGDKGFTARLRPSAVIKLVL
jgi:hypothetical protein